MLPRKELLNIKPYKPGKPIEELQKELGLKDVIKLASNENPVGPSPKALEAIRGALFNVNRYPDGSSSELRQKLAMRLKVKESNIVIGNGSDEIILLVLRAVLNKGDEVIIAKPTFLMYEITSRIAGAKIVEVPMKGFCYDLNAMKDKITAKTKLVFIANPDNPVGTYIKEKDIIKFMDGLSKDLLIFFDEAYYEFANSENDYPYTLSYLGRRNIIITRTFSKAYGLAGLRIGYGVADAELISYLDRARQPFNVNSLAQKAACAALDDNEFLAKTKKMVASGKRYLYRKFAESGLKFVPSAANFILVDVTTDANALYKKLLRLGVIVRDMSFWKLNTFIRVTVGRPKENERLIFALKKVLNK